MIKGNILFGYSIIAFLKFIPAIIVLYSSLTLDDYIYGRYVEILLYQGLYGLLISLITPQSYVLGVLKSNKIPLFNLFLFLLTAPVYFLIVENLSELKFLDKLTVWLSAFALMIYTGVKSYYEAKQEHNKLILNEQFAVVLTIVVMLYLVFIEQNYELVIAFGQGFFAVFMLLLVFWKIDKNNLRLSKFSILPDSTTFNYTWPLYTFNIINYLSKNFLGFILANRYSDAVLGKYGIIVRMANMVSELSVGPSVRYLLPEFIKQGVVYSAQYVRFLLRIFVLSLSLAVILAISANVLEFGLFQLSFNMASSEWLVFVFYSMAISVYACKGVLLNSLGKNKTEIVLALSLLLSTYLSLEVYQNICDTVTLVGLVSTVVTAVLVNAFLSNLYFHYAGFLD